jgi:GAF domain-containing protein
MTDIDNSTEAILKIVDITSVLEEQPNLEEGLREVAALTAQMLKTRRCSIMLLAETDVPESQGACLKVFTHYGNLPASAYAEATPLNQGIAGYVAATGTPLLIEDITKSEFASAARYPDAENKSLMSAPIFSGEQAIGTINVSSLIEKACFDGSDLEVLQLFALFVGKSIHIAQLQTILRSRFIQMAVLSDFAERQVTASVALNPNPTKLAKIVAKSFFRELMQAGFSANQIIEIATEVLNLLQNSLSKYSRRQKAEGRRQKEKA